MRLRFFADGNLTYFASSQGISRSLPCKLKKLPAARSFASPGELRGFMPHKIYFTCFILLPETRNACSEISIIGVSLTESV